MINKKNNFIIKKEYKWCNVWNRLFSLGREHIYSFFFVIIGFYCIYILSGLDYPLFIHINGVSLLLGILILRLMNLYFGRAKYYFYSIVKKENILKITYFKWNNKQNIVINIDDLIIEKKIIVFKTSMIPLELIIRDKNNYKIGDLISEFGWEKKEIEELYLCFINNHKGKAPSRPRMPSSSGACFSLA